ncbi:RagB/SusD family nutrient uptake outer membrane protein [Chitinophaga horti]|uniref:RagB/SusD family nutrient uptake outer membrane protein n=1 Tax=Chitinophaga horti TaxID=2920382 RepID=A0ABY6J8C4_9BACT|nr:RagB/SusD family nutrient uptake outer membrane protein [Chitinophaga horti]UYQ94529.1 RagB/SusD family nutrient uptake outer membrane protein [Chitinophaga horti]
MTFNNKQIRYIAAAAFGLMAWTSCAKFVDVPLPISQISNEAAFANDESTQGAMRGIYAATQNVFGSGPYDGTLSVLLGISSDELTKLSYSTDEQLFFDNNLSAQSSGVRAIWGGAYSYMYMINNLILGVERSKGISATGKANFLGEAHFLRALNNFYLVNLYDSLPMIVTPEYTVNALLSRTAPEKMWDLIVSDLDFAEKNITTGYNIPGLRYRANRDAARALQARVFLYRQQWKEAEEKATSVIESGNFRLEILDSAFLIKSREAILQFANAGTNLYTLETGKLNNTRLSAYTVAAFEPNDRRRTKWVKVTTDGFGSPSKTKITSNLTPMTPEAIPVLRLAEQYLIRAEARAMQDNLPGAIQDVDSIRFRAGLPLLINTNPTIDKEALLLAIEKERQTELFGEMGHRWLDVKRRGQADVIFGARKPRWRKEAAFFPIPFADRQNNPNLGQNPGYE